MAEERGAIAFAERVMALLDDGSFTATYKYAVLLGLTDLCLEGVSSKGLAPDVITTRQLAEKVIELYWPHTVPYPGLRAATVLRQNTRGQAEIVSAIRAFRESLACDPLAPFARARASASARFERLVRNVEWKLIEMPLPRLQRVGSGEQHFIYDIGWDNGVRLQAVRQYQRDGSGAFDNRVLLKAKAGEYFIQLNGLLRPLLHRHWAAMVARLNDLEESRLERFLFGSERGDLARARRDLLEVQHGRCFYCGASARSESEVDHFIPWSRYPDDGIENLVLADRRCNGAKRDFLASSRHVARWRERLEEPGFKGMAATVEAERPPGATIGVARAIYWRLPEGFMLWDEGTAFATLDRDVLRDVLS